LDLNDLDLFGRLPSANENSSPKPSSESIGPTPPSTMMSEPSPPTNSEQLTLSVGDSHVSRGPLPGSREAQKMTVTSGRSWLPLLKSYSLDGSLGRMCEALLTNRWASSAAFLTWKVSDTKPRHLLFQLAPSMPRTDEIVSGLWPTPTTPSGGGERSKDRAGTGNLHYMARKGNLAPTIWPTPTTSEAKSDTNNVQNRIDKGKQVMLCHAVRMWPTPTAHLAKETNAPSEATRNEPTISSLVGGSLNPTWVEWLMGFPEGWTDLKPSEMPSSRKSSSKSDVQ
jgi:hypothetical protein